MRFRVFLYELQRRHVIKAGVAYLVVAWLIVQVLVVFTDAFNIPQQTLPLSIIIMVICFPSWLIINWFYDITEDGIIRIHKEEIGTENVSRKSVRLNKIIITTLSIIIILLIINTFRISAEKNAVTPLEAPKETSFKTVAVLAFTNMSPEKDNEYFADGISQEIINKLTRYKELNVTDRISSFYYKNKDVTLDVIGRELNVAFILEGSVRQSGEVFRITAELVDVSDGSHIWSDAFNRTMEDLLTVQEEIATEVAQKLEVTLLNEEIRERKIDRDAYLLYLKANEEIRKYSRQTTVNADSLIKQSLALDDSYSMSWSLMAQTLYFQTFHYFLLPTEKGIEHGKLAARRALEIDSTNAMGYVWQSKFSWQDKQADKAAVLMDKALEFAPNDPEVLYHAGNFALSTNQIKKAEGYYERAMVLNPKGAEVIKRLSFVKWTQGDLQEAEKLILQAYSYELTDFLKNYELAMLSRDKGNLKKAIKFMENEEDSYLRILLKCSLSHAMGKEKEASLILEEIKTMTFKDAGTETIDSDPEHDYEIACLYAYMKQGDSAFVYLDRAYEHVLNWPEGFFSMPDFNNLKEDPRWEAYLRRMGQDMQYDFLTHR